MKKIRKTDFRVEVTPIGPWTFGRDAQRVEQEYNDRCEQMVEEIKRHVDNVGHVSVLWDEHEECSFCGYEWEEPDPDDPSFCCDKAEEEWKLERSAE